MNKLWGREPAMILALVQALVAVAVGFGLDWSGEQVSLVMGASAAVLGVITRSQVTPTRQIPPTGS